MTRGAGAREADEAELSGEGRTGAMPLRRTSPQVLGTSWTKLDTPALLVDLDRLEQNLDAMAIMASSAGLDLRPHFKTHRSVAIAQQQLTRGAVGVTVAKLDEAAALIDANWTAPILLAYQLVAPPKLDRAMALASQASLILAVDGSVGAAALASAARRAGLSLEIWIEIESGLARCGVLPADAPALAASVVAHDELQLGGMFTHAGQAYAARGRSEMEAIAAAEADAVVQAARATRETGIDVAVVSAGSTPSAPFLRASSGLTEMRPGAYVFNDCIQVALGTSAEESCALTVAVTVISRPTPERAVIDAGSKSLGLDRGAHSTVLLEDFGRIVGEAGRLVRLSEEHGVISLPPSSNIEVGDRLRIVPNHACSVTSLGRKFFGVRGHIVEEVIPIDAAGAVH